MMSSNEKVSIMRHTIINQLASVNGASTYLEIGVARGITFRKVNIKERNGVDPDFKFDYKALEDERTSFFQTVSDDFFSSLDPSKKFDLFFIDGLHTFEQTLRDFNNAIGHAHDKSIFIIDDVCPKNVYSAYPSQKEAARLRRMEGIRDGSWMGDVYKLIFFLHDFYPQYSFATIIEKHAQTVVWKRQRKSFQPIFSGVEEIGRSGYLEYLRVKDQIMNFMPFQEILLEVGCDLA